MNVIISVIQLKTPKETRKAIKFIVDQLEKLNTAICLNGNAVRLFGKRIPETYKDNETIIFSKGQKRKGKKPPSVITLKPDYKIERCGDYCFRIKIK